MIGPAFFLSFSKPFLTPSSINPARPSPKRLYKTATLAIVAALFFSLQVRASGDREVLTKTKAVYPEMAKRMKIAGTVLLHATVEPSGKVKSVTTVMGENLLVEAAKEAVLHWKYALSDVETVEDVEISFPE